MTATETAVDQRTSLPLTAPRLPNWAPGLVAVVAFGAAGLLAMLAGWGIPAFVALGAIVFIAALPLWSASIEGRRGAVDRLMTALVWTAFAVAVIPLVWLIWTVLDNGLPEINVDFLTFDMRNVVGDAQGGIYHAIMGTLLVTLAAAIISVPVGLFCAIYLVEYGKGTRLARWITFLVDVMTGIPSIVAGLFALALFVLFFGPEIRLGFGGSVALSLLMIPIVVRSTEEMLRLVPDDLREASYALGVPKWLTIVRIVLPTSIAGITTGVMLSISRVIGETAPLLIVAGITTSMNYNPFADRMTSLPVFVYFQYVAPGTDAHFYIERAWAGALTLILIVALLNIIARIVSYFFSPKLPR
jgi:phosphate transport system permease protein